MENEKLKEEYIYTIILFDNIHIHFWSDNKNEDEDNPVMFLTYIEAKKYFEDTDSNCYDRYIIKIKKEAILTYKGLTQN